MDPPSNSKTRGTTEKLDEEELGIDEDTPITTSQLAHDLESVDKSKNCQSDEVSGNRNYGEETKIKKEITNEDIDKVEEDLSNKSLEEDQIEGRSASDEAEYEVTGKEKKKGMRKRVSFKYLDLENDCEAEERNNGSTPEKLSKQEKLEELSPNQQHLQLGSELSNLLSYYGLTDPRRSDLQMPWLNECTYLQFEFFMEMFHRELQDTEAVFQNQVRETTERQLYTIFNALQLSQLKENVNTLHGHQQTLEDEMRLQSLWLNQLECALVFFECCYGRDRMQEDPIRNKIYNSASIINGQVKRACEELAELAAYNKEMLNGAQSSGPISTIVTIILEHFAVISRMEMKIREIETHCMEVSRLHHQFITAHTHALAIENHILKNLNCYNI